MSVTAYWCELAWLGGPRRSPACSSRSTDGRIAAVDRRCARAAARRRPARRAHAPRASPTPTPTPSTAPCAAAPRPAAARSGPGASRCTAWPSASTRTRYLRWRARPSRRWRWPASRRSASSTTSTTVPAARPTTTRTRWAARSSPPRPRPACGSRCSTPATSTAGSAGRPTRRSSASPTATPRRGPSGVDRRSRDGDGRRIGAAIHTVRAVDPSAAAIVAALGRERGAPLHAHVSEQPAENEDCLAAYGAHARPTLLADAGALGARFTAVHATHLDRRRRRRCSAARPCCSLPDDRARPGRRHRPDAPRSPTAGAALSLGSDSHAVIDLFEEARAVELDERLATGVRGHHSAADLLRAATAGGHALPRLARRRSHRRRRAGRPLTVVARRRPPGRRRARARARRRSCSPRGAATCAT